MRIWLATAGFSLVSILQNRFVLPNMLFELIAQYVSSSGTIIMYNLSGAAFYTILRHAVLSEAADLKRRRRKLYICEY